MKRPDYLMRDGSKKRPPCFRRRSKSIPEDSPNPFNMDLLEYLSQASKPKSTSQISESTEMAWLTARKHLRELFERGYVKRKRLSNKTLWKVNENQKRR